MSCSLKYYAKETSVTSRERNRWMPEMDVHDSAGIIKVCN